MEDQSRPPRFSLQLTGTNGNAFAVLGAFRRAARKAGWTPEQVTAVFDRATAGDYDHLLATLMDECDVR
jgi:hypothetical protein